jgi:hypothetical protein
VTSATATVEATATAEPLRDARVGAVAVLLSGRKSDEAVLATAVSIAAEFGARIAILALPRRVPLGAHCVALGYMPAYNVLTLRAEALVDAAIAAKQAADLVPAGISAEYVVVPGSPIRAMAELVERRAVAHVVVDRGLLVRRPRLRLASARWAREGMLLKVV